jgi:hypothetical protein
MESKTEYITTEEVEEGLAMLGKGYDEQQEIHDDSDLRKYRIELPNLYDDSNLDVYEFRLLAHYKRVGRCTEGLKTTAKKCKMSQAQVSEKRKALHEKGFIVMNQKPLPDNKGYSYVIFVVDKWLENFEKYSKMATPSPREGGITKRGAPSPRELKNLQEDEDFSKIITHWTNTHTFLNPTHATLIGCMLDEWREHQGLLPVGHPDKTLSPADVLIKAADITAKNAKNPHSIAYMDQVVKNFISLGFGVKPKQKTNEIPADKRPEYQPFKEKDNGAQYIPNPYQKPRIATN